jgi:hypothetical protein
MNPPRGAWLGRTFALTVLLGAFLLFQVQPLLSKWMLPRFGGGPAIWTTCLLFFQCALFVGYAYAHLSERWLPATARSVVHLGLILAAAALLPIIPSDPLQTADAADPTWRILALLGVHVGAPYVLLSSTGPLVQAWFSRAYPERSPYRLYALSNGGSLAALLSYPLLFEPAWSLGTQSRAWMWMFLAFAALYAVGTIAAARLDPTRIPEPEGGGIREAPPALRRVVLWLILPAFASWMLLAMTRRLCQDVAVVPLLWILPLAAYLLSFILSFDRPRWYKPRTCALSTAALLLATVIFHKIQPDEPAIQAIAIGVALGALFCLCMICHGELERLKPAPRHLTGFYLAVSAGGALGGVWVGLVAPLIFSTFLEWELGIVIAYAAAWIQLARICRGSIRTHRNAAACLLVVAVIGLALILSFSGSYRTRLETARNFYDAIAVEDSAEGGQEGPYFRDLLSGGIVHGRQHLDERDRNRPTAYYVEVSGIGHAVACFQDQPDMRVGIVGLGAGSMAAYGVLPGQSFRFYEINPEIKRLAERHFTFLKDCRSRVEVVLGDARLSLEREPPQRFHLLALDAFTGDAIPSHLLTAEAMRIYLKHILPEGIIAVHISNRYLDLAPVVRGASRQAGLKSLVIDYKAVGGIGYSSRWSICTRSPRAYDELAKYAEKNDDEREIIWTDDFSSLLPILTLPSR